MDWVLEQAQGQFAGGMIAATVVAGIMAFIGYQVRTVPTRLWGWLVFMFTTNMLVRSDDTIYWPVADWLAKQDFMHKSRRLRLVTRRRESDDDDEARLSARPSVSNEIAKKAEKTWAMIPAPGLHRMIYDGHILFIMVGDPEEKKPDGGQQARIIETIRFGVFGRDRAIFDKIVTEAVADATTKKNNKVRIYTNDGNYWDLSSHRVPRPLSSVITRGDVGEDLLADTKAFFDRRDWYVKRGIPWRRGYLLEGPPGTGKSSLALALASEAGLDVFQLNIGGITDQILSSLLGRITTGAVLLIEDIDTFTVAQNRSNEYSGGSGGDKSPLTMSGLLNALDGVSATEGRILIMTSNHPENIDPALIRPGRMDKRVHLAHFGKEESTRMWRLFYGVNNPLESTFRALVPDDMQPAKLQGMMMVHADDADALIRELRNQALKAA